MTRFDMIQPGVTNESSVYSIAAVHRKTGQRLLIKVSSLATREQLLAEIKRMNAPQSRRPQFIYTLTTEGERI